MTKVNNIKWLYLGDIDIRCEEEDYIKEVIVSKISFNKCPIKEILNSVDKELSLPVGTALVMLKRMIISKKIIVDLYEPINIDLSAEKFTVSYQEVKENLL